MDIHARDLHKLEGRTPTNDISLKPIGIFHSPLKTLKGIPIQFTMSDVKGKIEIFDKYTRGLKDLDGFSHIYCIYFFDLVKLPVPLQSKPFLDKDEKGVFSTRTPFRPNPIGLSILELEKIEKNQIFIKNADILDKTPVLDIKPYLNEFDSIKSTKSGWLAGKVRKKLS
ncbi:MAG: tRNA (N6-threonylcarbamoyladenosine(37)-N6)-methyltransferase TrmO [Candidatus Lokiarchaeota archaeon]|nr:tRNA (N6-threonylcarbamoyladenosine(37)-N6)-methyltransferase TrmO [Candidatus Lokiarchaeota archaeon]